MFSSFELFRISDFVLRIFFSWRSLRPFYLFQGMVSCYMFEILNMFG